MSDVCIRRLFVVMSVIAFCVAFAAAWIVYCLLSDGGSRLCTGSDAVVVVIDAGHGGQDPGCVFEGIREADINLDIALRLKQMLSEKDFVVVCTRESDVGVMSEGSETWKKTEDMAQRKNIIRTSGANLFVSIHQNSYADLSCRGAQVFYCADGESNESLALLLQSRLCEVSPFENERQALKNDSLYVLKGNSMPSVLIESGFLSNDADRTALLTEQYRNELAYAIYSGICIWFDVPY